MARLVGLGGRKTAGKDVVADTLVAHGWVKVGMSDNLHNCLMVLNPIIGRRRWSFWRVERYRDLVDRVGYVEAKRHREVRRLQQTLGTDVGRNLIDPDVWIKMTERTVRELLAEGRDVAVTGIRFQNELDMIRRCEGLPIWVERPGLAATDGHSSEHSLAADSFGFQIINDGTLVDLQAKALAVGGHA